jgi:hypothetical protein
MQALVAPGGQTRDNRLSEEVDMDIVERGTFFAQQGWYPKQDEAACLKR